MTVLALCTGNSARSVMAGAILHTAGIDVATAGTHVVEGQPISYRTRDALAGLGIVAGPHRSSQVTAAAVDGADLVLAMAVEHVRYVRREFPAAAAKTATIRRLCRDLPAGSSPLADRLGSLDLAQVTLEPWEDVEDPAGGDDQVYVACAKELADLCGELSPRLR